MLDTSVYQLCKEHDMLRYIDAIRKFPILSQIEEENLVHKLRTENDRTAAHTLITSHLRLVVKIAQEYAGYGMALADLVMEGNIGLMQAIRKFEPKMNCRVATYAMWWIKASIKSFILKSWSFVKIGTTQAQRKLFFGLRELKNKIVAAGGNFDRDGVDIVAKRYNVSERDVVEMDRRLSHNDIPMSYKVNCGNEQSLELHETISSPEDSIDLSYEKKDLTSTRMRVLSDAINTLNERERIIFMSRKMKENSVPLSELAVQFGVSCERVRQIEKCVMDKISNYLQKHSYVT